MENIENKFKEKFVRKIQVSCFQISNEQIIKRVEEQRAEIREGIIKILKEKGSEDLLLVIKDLKELKLKMKEQPRNIERLSEIESYLENDLMSEIDKI